MTLASNPQIQAAPAAAPASPLGRLPVAAILAIALLLRLAVTLAVSHNTSAAWFFGGGVELGILAESLRAGHGFSSPFGGSTGPTAFLAPGYPAVVASVFTLFGSYSHASALAVMLLQTLFGVITVLALMLLANRVFGRTVAYLAGSFWAVCPFALSFPVFFWETSFSIMAATVIVALAVAAPSRHTSARWLAMGLFAALVVLINPSLLSMIVACYGWAIYQARSRGLRAPALGIALCLLLSAPWAIRNAAQLHTFIPLRSNAGYELWQGNRPGADGFFTLELHPTVNRVEFARYARLGEVAYMRDKSTLAKAAISAHPARFAALTAKRAGFFWIGGDRQHIPVKMIYTTIGSVLGLLGLFLLWRRDRAIAMYFLLPIAFFPLPYYLTHPDLRFRMVLDPILTLLAVYALTSWRTLVPKRNA